MDGIGLEHTDPRRRVADREGMGVSFNRTNLIYDSPVDSDPAKQR
jgi:hypothetical protein